MSTYFVKAKAPEVVQRIRALRTEGHTLAEIAAATSVAYSTAQRCASRVVVRKEAQQGPQVASCRDEAREREIVESVPLQTLAEIARDKGISPERVRQIIVAYEKRSGKTIPRFKRAAEPKPSKVPPPSAVQRFLSHARLVSGTGCWVWIGALHRVNGAVKRYPLWGGKPAARTSYRFWRGEVPPKHVVVPQCGNDLCINPFHVEAVTMRERFEQSEAWDKERGAWRHLFNCEKRASRTHCKRGHAFTEENTYQQSRGRRCRECRRAWARARYRDKRKGLAFRP